MNAIHGSNVRVYASAYNIKCLIYKCLTFSLLLVDWSVDRTGEKRSIPNEPINSSKSRDSPVGRREDWNGVCNMLDDFKAWLGVVNILLWLLIFLIFLADLNQININEFKLTIETLSIGINLLNISQ